MLSAEHEGGRKSLIRRDQKRRKSKPRSAVRYLCRSLQRQSTPYDHPPARPHLQTHWGCGGRLAVCLSPLCLCVCGRSLRLAKKEKQKDSSTSIGQSLAPRAVCAAHCRSSRVRTSMHTHLHTPWVPGERCGVCSGSRCVRAIGVLSSAKKEKDKRARTGRRAARQLHPHPHPPMQ